MGFSELLSSVRTALTLPEGSAGIFASNFGKVVFYQSACKVGTGGYNYVKGYTTSTPKDDDSTEMEDLSADSADKTEGREIPLVKLKKLTITEQVSAKASGVIIAVKEQLTAETVGELLGKTSLAAACACMPIPGGGFIAVGGFYALTSAAVLGGGELGGKLGGISKNVFYYCFPARPDGSISDKPIRIYPNIKEPELGSKQKINEGFAKAIEDGSIIEQKVAEVVRNYTINKTDSFTPGLSMALQQLADHETEKTLKAKEAAEKAEQDKLASMNFNEKRRYIESKRSMTLA
jgi:hypothetical protein